MKLQKKFEELELVAFGPWLAAFKRLFSVEELEQEIKKIQPNEIIENDKKISELDKKRMEFIYNQELTREINEEIYKLKRKDVECKALFILPNDVKEDNDNVRAIGGDVRRVDKYKANINSSFNEITKKQMEDFYKLVTQLPEDRNEWSSYLQKLEKVKSYSPTEAVKEVVNIKKLVEEFEQSSDKQYHNNFELVAKGTNELLEYINQLPPETELTGQEHTMSHL